MKIWLSALVCILLTPPVLAEVPKVVTDIAPVHSIVARIMQGIGEPELIVPPAASPHDHAMRPSEARALADADIVVWMGPSLTPWLEDSIEALAGDAKHLTLQNSATVSLEFREGATFEAHEHEGHGHDEDHVEEEGHADEIDPHMWLDPYNAQGWIKIIAETLAHQDPDNAEKYFLNGAEASIEYGALLGRIQKQLDPFRGRPFVVFHDAFHYFEARFEVEAVGAISASDAQAPSPRRLREIEHVITDTGAVCVFAEPQFNAGIVAAVAGQTKIKLIDPLGFDLPLGPQMYGELLTQVAEGFADCLRE